MRGAAAALEGILNFSLVRVRKTCFSCAPASSPASLRRVRVGVRVGGGCTDASIGEVWWAYMWLTYFRGASRLFPQVQRRVPRLGELWAMDKTLSVHFILLEKDCMSLFPKIYSEENLLLF